MDSLQKAIAKAGSASALARGLGVSPMTISLWRTRSSGVVPVDRVMAIFDLTGVTPHELRPDIYPNPTDGLPRQEA